MKGGTNGNTHVSSSEMDPSKAPLVPASPCSFDDANENKKVETGAVSGAVIDNSYTSKSNQPQASNTVMGLDSDLDMDNRMLKRVMSNRISQQRSRMKKLQYLANIEDQVRSFQAQIANLISQVQSYETQKFWIMRQNEKLDYEIATLRKQTLLREAEIEKNKLELKVLRGVHAMQQGHLQALVLNNSNTSLEPMLNHQVSNYYQVSGNGEETFGIPPTQSQIQITNVQNEHEANIDLANYIGQVEVSSQNALNPNIKHHFARSDV